MDAGSDLARQYEAAMKLQRVREQGLPCSSCGAAIPVPDIRADSVECPHCGCHEALTDHVDGFTLEARRAYDERVEEMAIHERDKKRTDTVVIVFMVVGLIALCVFVFVFGK